MVESGQIYRCNVCGNITTVLFAGGGELKCCEQPMELLQSKDQDSVLKEHSPNSEA